VSLSWVLTEAGAFAREIDVDKKLMRYSQGVQPVAPRDRLVARRAKRLVDGVQLSALEADGVMALANHLMVGLMDLDERRQSLAAGDPMRNSILTEIEATAIRKCKAIQNEQGSSWGL